jgi:hypothetical protein
MKGAGQLPANRQRVRGECLAKGRGNGACYHGLHRNLREPSLALELALELVVHRDRGDAMISARLRFSDLASGRPAWEKWLCGWPKLAASHQLHGAAEQHWPCQHRGPRWRCLDVGDRKSGCNSRVQPYRSSIRCSDRLGPAAPKC